MRTPHVSVVIPVHNRPELLSRALRSAVGQTFTDLEIIVVDDASTDGIGPAVASVRDGRVRLIRHQTRQGAAAARNTGVRHARGAYLAFLDSDDEWLPHKLEQQLEYMHVRQCEVCCTSFFLHRENETISTPTIPKEANSALLFGCGLSPGSTLVTTNEAFSRVGPFLETLRRLEDWDWLLRCRSVHRILVVPTPLAHVYLDVDREKALAALAAANHIRSRRRLYGLSLGDPVARTKFESTILMEKSAAAYRAGRAPSALYWGLLCVALYPFRDRHFFKRRAGNLLELFRALLTKPEYAPPTAQQSNTPSFPPEIVTAATIQTTAPE